MCIFVWFIFGLYVNYWKCLVCWIEGYYIWDQELEEKVGNFRVKCYLELCKWKGFLKLLLKYRYIIYM